LKQPDKQNQVNDRELTFASVFAYIDEPGCPNVADTTPCPPSGTFMCLRREDRFEQLGLYGVIKHPEQHDGILAPYAEEIVQRLCRVS
jgi:hypothetical protein